MKKIIISLMMIFCVCVVHAEHENISTSQYYVDAKSAEKQDAVPANNANSVMTYDSTSADGIGIKAIYDTSASYAGQSKALVTASTANTAIQNGINNEFVCANPQGGCTLWRIHNKTRQSILPSGYTALEYLESDGEAYIDTGMEAKSGTMVKTKFQITGTPPAINTDYGFLGALNTGVSKYFLYLFDRNSSTDLMVYTFVADGRFQESVTITDHNIHTMEITNNGDYYMDNQLKGTGLYTRSEDSGRNIGIFRIKTSVLMRSFASRFYYVKLDNGTTRRDFIPARRDSDNELGMYDIITNTFFTNAAGTGEFIGGPIVNLYLPVGQ